MFVIVLNGKSKRIKDWFNSHVYKMYNFRTLYEEGKRAKTPEEIKRIDRLIESSRKKAEQHMEYGKSLGISEGEIRSFNLAIINAVATGRKPKNIIDLLIRENN